MIIEVWASKNFQATSNRQLFLEISINTLLTLANEN